MKISVLIFWSYIPFFAQRYTQYVNPFVGTGAHGHTFPGPCLPFGMVQLSPDTRLTGWDGCSGYHYTDSVIYGFSHTHLSGTGVSDYGDILLMPGVGSASWPQSDGRAFPFASSFQKENEKAGAAYYSVILNNNNIKVELTATLRTGIHRYTFPKSSDNYIFIDLRHRDKLLQSVLTSSSKNEVSGSRISEAWANKQHVYFHARFSEDISAIHYNSDSTQAILRFKQIRKNTLVVQLAISSVDANGAKNNLNAEFCQFDFDKSHARALDIWEQHLSRIKITDLDENRKTIFYTALYHTLIHPSLAQDSDGRYRGMDHKIYKNAVSNRRYTVFSLWDTYRAAHPLYQLVYPEYNAQFIQTFLQHAEEIQRLPVWELSSCETYCMIGFHSIAVIANAYLNGADYLKNDKTKKAIEKTLNHWEHSGFNFMPRGYIAANQTGESVSKTIENSLDYFAANVMGAALSDSNLSKAYQNVYNPQSGFFQAKHNEAFVSHFDPREVNQHYTEANAYQYLFGAHHNIEGMVQCFAGQQTNLKDYSRASRKILENRLDSLFQQSSLMTGREQSDITGLIGQYAHGNEPSHHIAYLYNYAGKPFKTQQLVKKICDEFYTNQPEGLIGNEDCGQMSAWYVFSTMGFYPVNPISPFFDIGLPFFDKLEISVPGKQAIIITSDKAKGSDYINNLTQASDYRKRINYGDSLHFILSPHLYYFADQDIHAFFDESLLRNINLAPLPFLEYTSSVFDDSVSIRIASLNKNTNILYRIEMPDAESVDDKWKVYQKPLVIDRSAKLLFGNQDEKSGLPSQVLEAHFLKKFTPVNLLSCTPFANHYNGGDKDALIDQRKGSKDFRDGFWQGWWGKDIECLFQIKPGHEVNRISINCLQDQKSWIFLPSMIECYGSLDNIDFVKVGQTAQSYTQLAGEVDVKKFDIAWSGSFKYIKIIVRNSGKLPEWHVSNGEDSWLFIDEIEFLNK